MGGTTTRIPLADARVLAEELVGLLEPTCERIEIAGSIRRERETVGDIELLTIPRILAGADMFGNPAPGHWTNGLDDLCSELHDAGVLLDRCDKNGRPAWGSRYKRALYKGVPLDLFSVIAPAQFGALFTIRTGPALFSHRLVTPVTKRVLPSGLYGLMPPYLVERQGGLHHVDGELIETPEETDFFAALRLPFVPPSERVDDWAPATSSGRSRW